MRILALNPCGLVGGAEISLMDVLEGLIARRHSVLLAAPAAGPLLASAAGRGIEVREWTLPAALRGTGRHSKAWKLAGSAPAAGAAAWSLLRLVRAARPDAIYSNGIKSHLLSAAIQPLAGVPVVWHVRDFVGERRLAVPLFALARRNTALVIANSHAVGREWKARNVFVEVVHNGFRVPDGGPAPQTDRSPDPRTPGGPLRLLAAGVLAPWKGFDCILRACALLPSAVEWRLTICGGELYETDGHRGERARLESLAVELGIAARVAFTGMVGDLGPYWRDADLLLHGSVRPEPFGRVVAEAMLAGVPPIASGGGGIPEFLRDGIDGLLYPMGDCGKLRDAIVELGSDPPRRRAMAASARQRIAGGFSIEAAAGRIDRLLSQAARGIRDCPSARPLLKGKPA
jgi:glycosyltransferase involved in cell wall biosynthesis